MQWAHKPLFIFQLWGWNHLNICHVSQASSRARLESPIDDSLVQRLRFWCSSKAAKGSHTFYPSAPYLDDKARLERLIHLMHSTIRFTLHVAQIKAVLTASTWVEMVEIETRWEQRWKKWRLEADHHHQRSNQLMILRDFCLFHLFNFAHGPGELFPFLHHPSSDKSSTLSWAWNMPSSQLMTEAPTDLLFFKCSFGLPPRLLVRRPHTVNGGKGEKRSDEKEQGEERWYFGFDCSGNNGADAGPLHKLVSWVLLQLLKM